MQIHIDEKSLQALNRIAKQSALETMEALKTDVVNSAVMPFDTGIMQGTDTFVDAHTTGNETVASLVTASPQARRLYFNPQYDFQQGKNKNAKGEWLEDYIPGGAKENFLADTFRERIKANI